MTLGDFGIIDGCYFADIVALDGGGAVIMKSDRNVLTDSHFKRCHSGINGGAVAMARSSADGEENAIKRSTFERCVDQRFAHLRIIHTIARATISYQVYSRLLRRSYPGFERLYAHPGCEHHGVLFRV